MKKIENNFQILTSALQKHLRRAKLWIEYMRYIDIVKDFIEAERTGNCSNIFKLQVKC